MSVELTTEEVAALVGVLDMLTGGSPENVFMWDGTDSMDNPMTRAWVKVFQAAGRDVPESCGGGQ